VSPDADSIPDAWPPPSDAGEPRSTNGTVVPLFPLPNVFLFPGTLMPLHIFEPRYRQMIEDSLDGPGRIVVSAILEGWQDQLAGAPPVLPVAGLGEIARHERLPDGRFMIWLAGLVRVRLREVPSDRLYRKVEVLPLPEEPASGDSQKALRARLTQAVRARAPELTELPADLPLGRLTDLLLMNLQLPQGCMQDLYSRLAVAERAERVLREHDQRPLPPRKHPGGGSN